MTDPTPTPAPAPAETYDALFAALCNELGHCLHDKGQKRVIAVRLPTTCS